MRKLYAIVLAVLSCSLHVFGQDITITGKVTDSNDGLELPGVTVQIKDTDRGTITNFEGVFTLDAPSDATLIFSYLGYQTQEIAVGNQNTIDVALEEESEVLDEVVVIGYGVVEKGDVTGAVKSVDEAEFNKGVIAAPDQLLNGKVAGVQVVNNSGEPGGQATVRIRGGTSLRAGGSDPLYVIDGVPVDNTSFSPGGLASGRNPLNFINPSEIENITVLKDASATAIYGSRGANGVIMITTKGGGIREGKGDSKPTINYNGNYAVSTFNDDIPILSPNEFRAAIASFDPDNANDPDIVGPANTDWVSEITQRAVSEQHNLSIGQNIENGNYRFSTGYQKIEGIIKGSRNERYNLNFNVSKGLFDNQLTFKFSTKNGITSDRFGNNQLGSALSMNPTQPIFYDSSIYAGYDEAPNQINGDFNGYFEYNDPLTTNNPVAENREQQQVGSGFRNLTNFEINYKLPFIPGLSIRNSLSYDARNEERISFSPSYLKSQQGSLGYYTIEEGERNSFLYEGILQYEKSFESIEGNLTVLGGYSYQDFNSSFTRFEHDELFTNAFGTNAPSVSDSSEVLLLRNTLENRLISFYSRAIFDFKDKYLITATIRRDGSTRFGEDNRWGIFPSFAAGWRISNESFYQPLERYVNYLKIRVGWGITGSQDAIADYAYIQQYAYSRPGAFYQLGNQFFPLLRPTGADPNLKWEETSSLNLGIDWEILKGRVAGSINLYQKNTRDLLNEIAFPAGIQPKDIILTNIGEVENRGIEFEITAPIMNSRDFSWNVSFNAAYNQFEIVNLDNTVSSGDETLYPRGGIAGDVGQNIQVLKVGEAFEAFYAHEQLYDDAGNPIYDDLDETNMYRDLNGDGEINEDDLRIINKPAPDWIFGLTNVMNYRNFDLAFTFRANVGNYVYNNFASNYGELNRLTAGTPQNIHTSALETGFERKQLLSDYFIENASFLRLDNVTLGYTVKKLDWMSARVFVTGQNLFVITGYSGFDPELNNGIDNNGYPRPTIYTGGVSLTF